MSPTERATPTRGTKSRRKSATQAATRSKTSRKRSAKGAAASGAGRRTRATRRKRQEPTLQMRLSGGPGEGIVLHRPMPDRPTSRYLLAEIFE